jgi:hypothetical protein
MTVQFAQRGPEAARIDSRLDTAKICSDRRGDAHLLQFFGMKGVFTRPRSNSEVELPDADFRFTPQSRHPTGGLACPKGARPRNFACACPGNAAQEARRSEILSPGRFGKTEPAASKYLTVAVVTTAKKFEPESRPVH